MAKIPRSNAQKTVPIELENYLPFRLSVTSNKVSRVVAQSYESKYGLTISDVRVMAVLTVGPMTQQEIVNKTMSDKVTISRSAHRMVNRGILQRSPHKGDGRSHHLALTQLGWRIHKEFAPVAAAYQKKVTAGLTGAEYTALLHLLRRIEAVAETLIEVDENLPTKCR